jgi:hypothetical protein
VSAFLTRSDDYFIPLRKRIDLARKVQADVFISIHCNASRNHDATGTEVYFLSLTSASDEAARSLAEAENAADMVGGVPANAGDELTSILFDLRQNDTIRRSSELAEILVDAIKAEDRLTTRGVKQAGFVVLKAPEIPAVLVETAFITNLREAAMLRTTSFRRKSRSGSPTASTTTPPSGPGRAPIEVDTKTRARCKLSGTHSHPPEGDTMNRTMKAVPMFLVAVSFASVAWAGGAACSGTSQGASKEASAGKCTHVQKASAGDHCPMMKGAQEANGGSCGVKANQAMLSFAVPSAECGHCGSAIQKAAGPARRILRPRRPRPPDRLHHRGQEHEPPVDREGDQGRGVQVQLQGAGAQVEAAFAKTMASAEGSDFCCARKDKDKV